ncbi:MAG: hypothetical protein U9R68_04730 [Planctomycetota bacterium]|nr:hypothetical protein [Planctomycetota bacterium]
MMMAVIALIGTGTLVGVWAAARAGESGSDPDPKEELGWTIYWETYDEPAGDPNIPIEDHPSEPANGGQRIFPGKKTHEVGHTALGPDDNPNSHNDIMTELGVRSAARFIDEDIATLRSLEDFTSWWW